MVDEEIAAVRRQGARGRIIHDAGNRGKARGDRRPVPPLPRDDLVRPLRFHEPDADRLAHSALENGRRELREFAGGKFPPRLGGIRADECEIDGEGTAKASNTLKRRSGRPAALERQLPRLLQVQGERVGGFLAEPDGSAGRLRRRGSGRWRRRGFGARAR